MSLKSKPVHRTGATPDNGKQISLWTVAKELGHKNVQRVEDTYGHPSHQRVRGEVVEYRLPAD